MIDRAICWFAWRLPRRLVYWCAIRVFCETDDPAGTVREALAQYFNRHFIDRPTDRP